MLGGVCLGLRVGLSAALVVAAVGKLLDLPGSRQAVNEFGLSKSLAKHVGTVLPFLELSIAAALLPNASGRWGALAALLLFATFALAMLRVWRQGKAPNCHCFGQLHSAPVGLKTILRTAGLALVSAFAVALGPGDSLATGTVPAWLLATLAFLLAVATVAAVAPRLQIRRYVKSMLKQTAPLVRGDTAPNLTLTGPDGSDVELWTAGEASALTAIVFTSPGCGHCEQLLPRVAQWQRTLAGRLGVVVAHIADRSELQIAEEKFGSAQDPIKVWSVPESAFQNYALTGTPSALVVDTASRTVVSPTATGANEIETLIRDVLRGRIVAPQVRRNEAITSPAATEP